MARLPFCLCGVRGGDLASRIDAIMTGGRGSQLTRARRTVMVLGAVVAIAAPVVVGALTIRPLAPPLAAVSQEPAGAPVAFEVAAVRLNTSGQRAAQFNDLPGGRFVAVNTTVRMLILDAYRIPDRQLVDAPNWTTTERVDVNARLEREAPIVRGTAGERQFALRSLLAERFKLQVHRETRQSPMYALVMARADRKPGPILKSSSTDCSPDSMRARADAMQAGKQPSGICGTRVTDGRIQFGGRMTDLARVLSGSAEVGRYVIDQTGLIGGWEFELTRRSDDPNEPLLITALQEQLGLKLESIQGPLEFLVVDRIERLDK